MSCEQHYQYQRHPNHHHHYQQYHRQQQYHTQNHQYYSQNPHHQQEQQQQYFYSHQPHNQYQLWFIISVILFLIDISHSLTMTEVKIPNHIMRFKSAVLGCRYNLDGESLYSVKWYKDGHEFYRYVPRDKPPGQAFPLPGVNVDVRNSSDTKVTLRRVTLMSTGLYKCEVSGEAPAFNTVSESETMTVVMTPNHGPRITGGHPRYQIGDIVRLNCTSAPSKPVCHLSWLINGEPANRSYLKPYEKLIVGREGLEIARLGLEFRVKGIHFNHGDMKLKVFEYQHIFENIIETNIYIRRTPAPDNPTIFSMVLEKHLSACPAPLCMVKHSLCVAKISSLYWQSNEASVESDRQQRAPALESRETVAAKSRGLGSSSAKPPSYTTLQQLNMATLLSLFTAFSSNGFSLSIR